LIIDLLASNIINKTQIEIKKTVTVLELIYREDLHDCNLLQEAGIWQTRLSHDTNTKLKSVIENLKVCDSNLYPGLHVVFHIFCVLPVTTCECEPRGSTQCKIGYYADFTFFYLSYPHHPKKKLKNLLKLDHHLIFQKNVEKT
jgi:hypothetical protein